MLIAQCEFVQDICKLSGNNKLAATSQMIQINFQDTTETYKASLTGSFTAQKSSCTFLTNVLCGAPTLKIGSGTNLADNEVIISFVEYSNEFTENADPKVELEKHNSSSTSGFYLPKNLKPAYYTDETVLGGTIPEIVQTDGGRVLSIPGQIIVDWMQWFESSYDDYAKQLEEYNKKLADWE